MKVKVQKKSQKATAAGSLSKTRQGVMKKKYTEECVNRFFDDLPIRKLMTPEEIEEAERLIREDDIEFKMNLVDCFKKTNRGTPSERDVEDWQVNMYIVEEALFNKNAKLFLECVINPVGQPIDLDVTLRLILKNSLDRYKLACNYLPSELREEFSVLGE